MSEGIAGQTIQYDSSDNAKASSGTPLDAMLRELDTSVVALGNTVATLLDRLDPVLLPDRPRPVDGPADVVPSEEAQVVRILRGQAAHLDALRWRVVQVLERLVV